MDLYNCTAVRGFVLPYRGKIGFLIPNSQACWHYLLKHLLSLKESNIDVLTVDAKLLHISANVIYKSLTKLINMSISTGQIPEDSKLARF